MPLWMFSRNSSSFPRPRDTQRSSLRASSLASRDREVRLGLARQNVEKCRLHRIWAWPAKHISKLSLSKDRPGRGKCIKLSSLLRVCLDSKIISKYCLSSGGRKGGGGRGEGAPLSPTPSHLPPLSYPLPPSSSSLFSAVVPLFAKNPRGTKKNLFLRTTSKDIYSFIHKYGRV